MVRRKIMKITQSGVKRPAATTSKISLQKPRGEAIAPQRVNSATPPRKRSQDTLFPLRRIIG